MIAGVSMRDLYVSEPNAVVMEMLMKVLTAIQTTKASTRLVVIVGGAWPAD